MEWHGKNSRTLVGTEASFDFTLGRAVVRGSIDRLEITSEGAYVVVDLKTGSTALSKEESATTAQLQLYQLAVVDGAVANANGGAVSAGAELLYVGTSAKTAAIRQQPVIDVEEVRLRVSEAADGMAASDFAATENELCRHCDVRNSCPLMIEGRSVVQP
jgi:RecB family exonuclease